MTLKTHAKTKTNYLHLSINFSASVHTHVKKCMFSLTHANCPTGGGIPSPRVAELGGYEHHKHVQKPTSGVYEALNVLRN